MYFIYLATSNLYKTDSLPAANSYSNPFSILGTVLYLIIVLAFVSGLAYISLKIMYARSNFSSFSVENNLLNIVERLPLAQNKYLFLVKIGKRFYLLSATDKDIAFLTEVTDENLYNDFLQKVKLAKQQKLSTKDFSHYLNYFKDKFKGKKE